MGIFFSQFNFLREIFKSIEQTILAANNLLVTYIINNLVDLSILHSSLKKTTIWW
jgi:hypothetical protein